MIDPTLNNGVVMPALGVGVFQTPREVTAGAVEEALRVGYRHIDTAAMYLNEREVGEGIRRSGLDRDEIFIETKIWVTDYGYDATLSGFEKSAGKLKVDTIDLLILHQPVPARFDTTVDAYRALETLLAEGRVRAIGVSNFTEAHLAQLRAHTSVTPAVNQVELHPYFTQHELCAEHAARGIITQALSPLGGITHYPVKRAGERRNVMSDEEISDIARAHGVTSAQVMLRWHLQQRRSAIPKSSNPARTAENFAAFDFELSPEDLARIDALNTGQRSGPDPDNPPDKMFLLRVEDA